MIDTFITLPLAAIVSSLTNPRKTFNPVKLTELSESIKASGVHQPILVRPLPGSRVADTFDIHAAGGGLKARPTHEIVAGERRYRASLQAGLETIPALVRKLTDDQALEVQIVENLQRDDLSALEEAEGYDQLMASQPGLTAEAIGGKIGKSRSHVYGRLKLLDLSVECKEAMRAGQIDASRALLIARIPDTALQTKALAEATRADYRGEVCSVRALQSWLQANVMLKLDMAMFNIADSTLTAAGSCTSCPKRTGASPDLFADVQSVDICTDPACFHDKEAAHRTDVLATAEKRGMRLIEGDEARKIIPYQWTAAMTGYSPLTQERTDTTDGQPATLGQLLGKDLDAAVLIENPWSKELVAAIPTDEAEAMLLARGLVKAVQAKAVSKDALEGEIKKLKSKVSADTTKLFRANAFVALANAVHGCDDELARNLVCPLLLRAWWMRQVDEMSNKDLARVFGLELVQPEVKTTGELQDAQTQQMRLHAQACDSGKLYKALALWVVLEDCPDYFYGDIPEPTLLEALASECDVDLDDIEVAAAKEVRDSHAGEIKKLTALLKSQKTEAEKSPTTEPPAAQAKGGGGKSQKSPAALASPLPVRKRKMTADEAKEAIAAAMQGTGTNPGADAQGDDGTTGQPVATSTPPDADAPAVVAVAQAGDDPDYARAVELVRKENRATISMVQRRLNIGYNAAARLLERMELEGIVSRPMKPEGVRTVMVQSGKTKDDFRVAA